ncbi:DUF5777 family beta-barrel protein [Flavobacterium sp.]|uniref:DUF5777 family beta-barrel protein n=1 Tax=Flavobacterium sp. TaxID=239 RepID=UPI0025BE0E3D|nr:DUF5777 family beta-barrel protein [Flavobacterium sp.]MBA4153533.1 hypothetical protein [Flavobacterium sp.]
MKLYKLFVAVLSFFPLSIFAQETTDTIVPVEVEYEKAAFESSSLVDNQTDRVYSKGTVEFIMNHRFGMVDGSNDMIGIWGVANIRLALTYAVTDRITVGFGTSKENRLQDFNLKAAIFKQTVNGKMPFNLTYYGNWTVSALPKEEFEYTSDRWSFFNQLILTRRMSKSVSFLLAPSYSHYNLVESTMQNDMLALGAGGKYTFMQDLSIIVDFTTPLMKYEQNTPKPGFGIGIEYGAVQHAFQLFISNSKGIVNQQNIMYNQNEFFNGEFMIGFNIMKSW